jgi:pantetheine-phosphate adenylyltransferase
MTMKVCLGGTFNVIHEGHLALLSRAFAEGGEVFIGLTGDDMAGRERKVKVKPYEQRMASLRKALAGISCGKPFHIFEIRDEFGPAATGDFDVIVVSEETAANAGRINNARNEAGLAPLRVVVIGMVLDGEGNKVSSSGIIASGKGKDNA